MSTSSNDSTLSLKTQIVTVPAGVTAAVFINGGAVSGCNTIWLQLVGGSTLLILADGTGSTMSQAALITQGQTTGSFFVPTPTPFMIPGPANFYIAAGATQSIVNVMYGKT